MPRTEREREGEEVERGESELNDLASRLQAHHVSQTALRGLGLGPRSHINYSHAEEKGRSRMQTWRRGRLDDGTNDNRDPLHFLYKRLSEMLRCRLMGTRAGH